MGVQLCLHTVGVYIHMYMHMHVGCHVHVHVQSLRFACGYNIMLCTQELVYSQCSGVCKQDWPTRCVCLAATQLLKHM